MTREEIIAMEPGIELDRLVSVHVMGFEIRKEYLPDQSYHEYYYREGWKYENVNYPDEWQPSRLISAAWEVLEHLKDKGAEINIGYYEQWDCSIDYPIGCNWRAAARTAPEAICKAALLAVLEG